MLSLYINSISLRAKVKPSMHYLAQMRLFYLGPLCVQLVSKVTSSHTDSNTYTLLQPKPRNSKPFHGLPKKWLTAAWRAKGLMEPGLQMNGKGSFDPKHWRLFYREPNSAKPHTL